MALADSRRDIDDETNLPDRLISQILPEINLADFSQKDIAAKLPVSITGCMKQLDEREYHLSNFHRDLMEAQSPAIAEGYEFLQAAREQAERDLHDRQCELRDYIRTHKLKATKKPEHIERERLRRLQPRHDPEPITARSPVTNKIAALIASLRPAE